MSNVLEGPARRFCIKWQDVGRHDDRMIRRRKPGSDCSTVSMGGGRLVDLKPERKFACCIGVSS